MSDVDSATNVDTEWRCCGCGAAAPGRVASCDCPTQVVYVRGTKKHAWKAGRQGRPDSRIAAAALVREGVILTMPPPARHHNLVSALNMLGVDPNDWGQGFIDSDGQFLDRFRARQVALRTGQVTKTRSPSDLFSEDLW